jgi:hypothetical protein
LSGKRLESAAFPDYEKRAARRAADLSAANPDAAA